MVLVQVEQRGGEQRRWQRIDEQDAAQQRRHPAPPRGLAGRGGAVGLGLKEGSLGHRVLLQRAAGAVANYATARVRAQAP